MVFKLPKYASVVSCGRLFSDDIVEEILVRFLFEGGGRISKLIT